MCSVFLNRWDMETVTVQLGDQSVKISKTVWQAFLSAAAWPIDSGDIYALLNDLYSKEILREVIETKGKLDVQLRSS